MTSTRRYRALVLAGLLTLGGILVTAGLWRWLHAPEEQHGVTLTWNPPRPAAGVTIVGYNVYRRVIESSELVKIATGVQGPPYEDHLVSSGRTYFYVVTSVDQKGRESRFSEPAQARIP